MNNYPNFKNYNAYPNIHYNNNNIEDNKNVLYDPYNGFIRGNLFKSIYDPYKNGEPYDVKPINEQAAILTNIDSLGFAMTDLNLYLDIYPNNQDAINLFNQYRVEKEKLTSEYESKYGPISLTSDSLKTFPWSWDNIPWPWDN